MGRDGEKWRGEGRGGKVTCAVEEQGRTLVSMRRNGWSLRENSWIGKTVHSLYGDKKEAACIDCIITLPKRNSKCSREEEEKKRKEKKNTHRRSNPPSSQDPPR